MGKGPPTERLLHVPNVNYTCGAVPQAGGAILIHCGDNETVMNVGVKLEDVLVALFENHWQGGWANGPSQPCSHS